MEKQNNPKDRLHYFRIANCLNEKHHDVLLLKQLHFRGNINSFSLVSISQEFPEQGEKGLKKLEKGEEKLGTISLEKPKGEKPEKSIQAWIIDHARNNQLRLPFGNYRFLTSELAFPSLERKKGFVNDILAFDDENALVVIEIKYDRLNEVKKQAIAFESKVVKGNEDFFHELIELLLNEKWNGTIRKVAVWPAKEKVRAREHPDVEEVSYEPIKNAEGYSFKYEYKPGSKDN